MDIYVLNSRYERIKTIDEYESCIWNIKYFNISDFELYISASCDNLKILKRGNYLVRDKDIIGDSMYNVMIIEKVETQTDVENEDKMLITGRDLRALTSLRIIWNQTNLNGKVETELRRLLIENIINPADETRKIDNVELAKTKGFTETMAQQVTGDNLSEYIVSVLTAYGIGWRAYVNNNGSIEIEFYKGVNRSVCQTDNAHVIFSPDNENNLNSTYSVDYSNYKNVALVAGEGEGTARKRTTVYSSEYTGLNRYELYVDARNVSSNNGDISDSEYLELLKQNGIEKLQDNKQVETFEGEIETMNMYIYGRDFDLGDIVTVSNMYEITSNTRIIGVIESNSNEGESIIPTFGSWN